ncbi:PIG-L family deacetylase [Herbiconiux sp. CPCC 205763]|uniref:PIG-L family deacetylase n=1 Tax=Herbiconiux aconitum TaxID=2970913 RepID=A0ABT2GSE8_9MICO|nr:bifunctional PIG-L family deacetylase/class I SAM-dependent methyltransferase [Herbiconiux aconitum]MCS5719154.1 PIG-L family deacetylase [Herbiconiux aconitum]
MTTPDSFSHRDDGTPEGEWQRAFGERMPEQPQLGPAFFQNLGHLVVVAAHPDDETLGAAGLVARAGASGARVTVIVATSGEGSHPDAPDLGELARRREDETRCALAEVDPGATVHFLRLPDGRLSEHRFALAQAIAEVVGPDAMAGRGADRAGAGADAGLATDADATAGPAIGAGAAADADADADADAGASAPWHAPHRDRAGRHAAPSGADHPAGHGAGRPDANRPITDGTFGGRDERRGATVLVAPWVGDRHPDHAAAAVAASAVAQTAGLELLGYPIWLWHWARPADQGVPWARLRVLALDDSQRAAKARAVAAHASQVLPLGDAPDEEPLLHSGMLAHFARPFECFVVSADGESPKAAAERAVPSDSDDSTRATSVAPGVLHDGGVAADYFDALHRGADDPWGFESRWYEERKRAVLLASLPDRSYGEVLEVGSSTGVLSRALAARTSGRLVGVDVSEVAVERARERNADLQDVSFERMRVPAEWPSGSFDLVVVSEVGYYLDPPDLTGLIERILGSLTPLGAVICCHWRHPVAGRAIDGDGVHAVFADRPEFARLARHLEEDFVLDVLVRTPGESVARRERIV